MVMRRLGGAAAPRGKERKMKVIDFEKKAGIGPARAFAEKELATHSCNVGILCGHGCVYCSTAAVNRHSVRRVCDGATLRMSDGVAILADADKFVASVDRDAGRMQPGVVELCTTVDAWSPEAQEHDLGRRCLDAILKHPGWAVRVLTKNAAVAKDFDLIDRHRDRVLVGLSITAPASLSRVLSVLEPNASTNLERMQAMVEAHERGCGRSGCCVRWSPASSGRNICVRWSRLSSPWVPRRYSPRPSTRGGRMWMSAAMRSMRLGSTRRRSGKAWGAAASGRL
jgi:DNA repair photolyase